MKLELNQNGAFSTDKRQRGFTIERTDQFLSEINRLFWARLGYIRRNKKTHTTSLLECYY